MDISEERGWDVDVLGKEKVDCGYLRRKKVGCGYPRRKEVCGYLRRKRGGYLDVLEERMFIVDILEEEGRVWIF